MAAPRSDQNLNGAHASGEAGAARASSPGHAPDRHARALIARIQRNWNDVEAIRALADHYAKAGDYPSLANLMEGWGDALEQPRAAADAYVEAADALLLAGRPGQEAQVLFERALSRDASHTQALDRLTRVLEEANDQVRLKQVLKYVAHQLQQQSGNRPLLASVHYRLGQVYEQHFGEVRKAATLYRQAIEENPRLIGAIAAARRLYLESGNLSTASALFELEIEASPNVEDKHALLLSLARHKREACDDLDGAVLAFRRAAKMSPTSVRALIGLAETLLARSERAEALAGHADRQRAAEVFYHLAQLVSGSDAIPYLQRALLIVPNHGKARAMLEALSRPARPEDRHEAGLEAQGSAASSRSSSDSAAAEAWLRDPELPPVHELSSGELLPIDEEAAAQLGLRDAKPGRAPSLPPPSLQPPSSRSQEPVPPRAHEPRRPTPAPPVAAAQPAPPAVAPAPSHPKIVTNLSPEAGRVALEINVGNTTDSNFYVGVSDELLDGGVFVATYSSLPIGTETDMIITLPGKVTVRAHGRVVLTRDLMDAFDDHIPGMCVEFERVDPRSFALIERFARKRAPAFVEL